jgi:uncharacterized membrane protein
MNLSLSMKLLHILTAFWFFSGIVARDISYWRAARATNIQAVFSLLQFSDFFERSAVIPGGMIVLLFGLITAWLQDWPILGFLQGAPSNWLLVSLILYIGISALIGPLRMTSRRNLRTQVAEEALAQGSITTELTAALNDKVVSTFRNVELVGVVFIIILMVMKPF